MTNSLICFTELRRQRTLVYIVVRGEATFTSGELTAGPTAKHYLWKEAKFLFPEADLAALELASGQSPPPGSTGWAHRIFVLGQSEVTTYGGTVTARDTARIIGHNRAGIQLLDKSIGFAFSGAQLFPHEEATAIAIEGVVVPQKSGANCFVGTGSIIPSDWPHHPFDGTQASFEAAWRTTCPTADPPRWPV